LILTDLVNVQRLAENKVIKEITDLDYQQFLNGLSEISVYEGKNYGIPFRAEDFLVFYYNQDYINSPPGDFEALLEYCQEVNDEQQQIYGFMLNEMEADWIIPFIGGYSDWIVDYANYSLSLDSEGTIKTLEFLLMIYDQQEPLIPRTTGYEEMNAMFKSGNLHMIINSITAAEEYISENLNIGVARIPEVYGENRRPTPLIWGTGFMINANCYGQELEATQSFIDFMLSDQQQIKWTRDTGTFPATIAAKDDEYIRDNRILADAFTQAQLCRGIPPDSIIRAIRDSIRINLPKVLEEEFPIEEAVAKIQEDGIRLRSGSITVEQLMEESLQQ
jgi:arabinogalactan oligomer/maltooligosaccharide transport system substrate-binding protein